MEKTHTELVRAIHMMTPDLLDRLAQLAKRRIVSRSHLVRTAVERLLRDEERKAAA